MPEGSVTIISMLPYDLREKKPGLNPSEFIIKAKGNDEFSLNLIDDKTYFMINTDLLNDGKEARFIKVPVPGYQIAESIINDYINSLLAVDPPDAVPGLFHVLGAFSDHKEFRSKFSEQLSFYKEAQNRWFQRLVDIADDTWSKKPSPIGISDTQREACKALGYARDWVNPIPDELRDKCIICMSPRNKGALKCLACGFIFDKKKYDEVMSKGAFAEVTK